MKAVPRILADPLPWAAAALALLVAGLPHAGPLFAALFPSLDRPLYRQESFAALLGAHMALVGAASAIAVALGMAAGIFATREAGRAFGGLIRAAVAMGQAFPPVAVLAVAVPAIGFGARAAVIALVLYGLLPVVENTIAGIEGVPAAVRDAARGMGMGALRQLVSVELPLAAPVIVAGVRTSVIVGTGTAAIASTVGARTLGTPIIVGLNGSNPAYVLQGALVVGLLAVVLDLAFERLGAGLARWR